MASGSPLFWFLTAAVVALAVGLGSMAPGHIAIALLLLPAYAATMVVGVLFPRLQMFAPVLCHVPDHKAAVFLTFDDGPGVGSTQAVLDELARHSAKATFFVLGCKARKHPEIVRAIAQAGHEIGIHGDVHDRLLSFRHPSRIIADIERARLAIEEAAKVSPRLFRPPLGHVSPRTAEAARKLGLTLVGWSVRGRDGLAGTSAASAGRRVLAGLRSGAIVLLHDASEHDRFVPAGVLALPEILDEAHRRGLACESVSRALAKETAS